MHTSMASCTSSGEFNFWKLYNKHGNKFNLDEKSYLCNSELNFITNSQSTVDIEHLVQMEKHSGITVGAVDKTETVLQIDNDALLSFFTAHSEGIRQQLIFFVLDSL
jgi:hypothetical protein